MSIRRGQLGKTLSAMVVCGGVVLGTLAASADESTGRSTDQAQANWQQTLELQRRYYETLLDRLRAQQADDQKSRDEYFRQQKEAAKQQEEYGQFLKEAGRLLGEWNRQIKEQDAILQKWRQQQTRFDHILDRWEQEGSRR